VTGSRPSKMMNRGRVSPSAGPKV